MSTAFSQMQNRHALLMYAAIAAVDKDWSETGSVTPETVDMVRAVKAEVAATSVFPQEVA